MRRLLLCLLLSGVFVSQALALPGDVDISFGGGDGIVTTNVGDLFSYAHTVLLQEDGKIVVVGEATSDPYISGTIVLARYASDGTIDPFFGNGGILTTTMPSHSWEDEAVLQGDGKIVVIGGAADTNSFVLVRYTNNGDLDPTFGNSGVVTTTVDGLSADYPYTKSLSLQADGKIVASIDTLAGVIVARYTVDGNPDATFGNGGIVTTALGDNETSSSNVVIQGDDKIVVRAGGTLVRYNSDGSLDGTFGNGGIASTTIDNVSMYFAEDLAIQEDGKLVVCGIAFPVSPPGEPAVGSKALLFRYNSDGTLDTTFGVDGIVIGSVSDLVEPYSISMQQDGKIVVVGVVGIANQGDPNGIYDFSAIARYSSDGVLDPTFGNNGIMKTLIGPGSWSDGVVIQGDGKIVVAGVGSTSTKQDIALVRYVGDSSNSLVPPASVVLPLTDADGSYQVSWSSSAGGVTYVLEEATDPTFTSSLRSLDMGTALSVNITGRTKNVTYYYRVKVSKEGFVDSAWMVAANGCSIILPNPLNDNTEFVKQIYRDFLNREADPSGLSYWVGELNAGRLTRAALVEQYLLSPEFGDKIAPVARLYFAYFLRIPDYGGLLYWVNEYASGSSTFDNISDFFAASPEFQATYGNLNNSQFVDLIYMNLFNRTADPDGKAYWVNELDSGNWTRGQVMVGFSESREYGDLMANPIYVTMTYVALLRRSPDFDSYNYWVNRMDQGDSGQVLIDLFLNSSEYAGRFK